jgi:hypothetical protein
MLRPTLLLLLLLAACANQPPVALSSQYKPPGYPPGMGPAREKALGGAAMCRVHLGVVEDRRADTTAMGEIGGRPIRAADAAGWVHSGLESLEGGRIQLVGESDSDVAVSARLIKAYVFSQTSAKSANIALTVHYDRHGAGVDRLYRGQDEGANWASGEDEAVGTLSRALAQVLEQIRQDLLADCAAAK